MNRGRPTKYTMTYAQKVWDNYNPYAVPKEYNQKEILTHNEKLQLARLEKAYTKLAQLAGYEPNKAVINILSKKALGNV